MSITSMMNDRIDIYRLRIEPGEESYGVPSQPKFYYEDEPDLTDVKCSVQKSGRQALTSNEGPFEVVAEVYNLYLPKGIEINERDKVVFKGAEMFADIPFTYRTHTEVELRRNDRWQAIT